MKKIILFSILVIIGFSVFSQNSIIVNKSNDAKLTIAINEIKNIKFVDTTVVVKPNITRPIYIIGDMNDWNNSDVKTMLPLFKDNSNTNNPVYTYIGFLAAGNYKFLPEESLSSYKALCVNSTNKLKYVLQDGGAFNIATAGYKSITINLNNMTYSISDYSVPNNTEWQSIGFIGDFCAWANEPKMFQYSNDNKHIWTLDLTLPALAEGTTYSVKFRANESWESRWAATDPESIPFGKSIFLTGSEFDPNIILRVGGSYHIVFNDLTGQYVFIETNPTSINPISQKNKVIYEANVYAYSTEGNFKGLEKDLPRLKELGVDIIWLMPIHPIGTENRIGTLGSPYSVRNYKAVNPDFGTDADFKSLIKAVHDQNMEIWMDWVANHTAWDNVWTTNHLNFYAEKDGQRPYSPNGWSDVIQLDYNSLEMRDSMINAMKYWVKEFNIDGYRCDAAALVPLSFWLEARNKVDSIKKITWLCEADDPTYMQAFDYNYDWLLSNAMNKFGTDNDILSLKNTCLSTYADNNYINKSRMVFFTNHDLNAFEGTEFQRLRNNVLPFTVFIFTIYDMPLIYNGQEIGMNKVMNFSERSLVEWNKANDTYINLYKKLIQLRHSQLALEAGTNRGALKIYPTNQENVIAYSRLKGNNEVLVILNLSNTSLSFNFTNEIPSGKFRNYLKNTYINFSDNAGISLPQNGYEVFVK